MRIIYCSNISECTAFLLQDLTKNGSEDERYKLKLWKYYTNNYQQNIKVERHFNLLLVVFCIVFPQFRFVTFTFRVIFCKTLRNKGHAFRNIKTIYNSQNARLALRQGTLSMANISVSTTSLLQDQLYQPKYWLINVSLVVVPALHLVWFIYTLH